MTMRIITWNINSLRYRYNNLKRLVETYHPNIICLQETKVSDSDFPIQDIINLGYNYVLFQGIKSYSGVAILSNIPLETIQTNQQSFEYERYISAKTLKSSINIHNFYVPAGGYEANIAQPKFKHKVDFLTTMLEDTTLHRHTSCTNTQDEISILLGDLNVAPLENDVWSHKQMINVVSHTPEERNLLNSIQNHHSFHDAVRTKLGYHDKLYTWWSYRNRDWKKSNRGRRLDHIWIKGNININEQCVVHILKEMRDWDLPSDHVAILLDIDI